METKKKGKWLSVGTFSVKKQKEGQDPKKKEYSFLVKNDVILKAGTYLSVQDPREQVKFFFEKGYITQEQYNERISKIPDFVKFEFSLPPAKDDSDVAY
jgi:hypothetical protein